MNSYITRKICDRRKNDDTIDIWKEAGDFQDDIGSTICHFLSSINEIKESLSLVPLYWRNCPLTTL